jgi:hypothetical protein
MISAAAADRSNGTPGTLFFGIAYSDRLQFNGLLR